MTGHSRGVLDRVLKVCTADSLRTVVSPKKVLEKYPALVPYHNIIHSIYMRGAETWGFHESPSYPNMYCFLAWRERIESTNKTHHVGT